jgi:hypothetical protein
MHEYIGEFRQCLNTNTHASRRRFGARDNDQLFANVRIEVASELLPDFYLIYDLKFVATRPNTSIKN